VCDDTCYAQTCTKCDSTCYAGHTCNTCHSTCYLEKCSTCHNECYSAYDTLEVFEAYEESIESACAVVKINSEKTAADFTSDVIEGVAPLTVTFTNSSTGSIYGYSWSFGNGATSTKANPDAVNYNEPGIYTVRLKTVGLVEDYSDEEIKESYIKVWSEQASPVAAFQANVVTGAVPLLVQFTDQSTGYYNYRKIDFGDGNVQIDRDPSLLDSGFFDRQINHAYQTVGTYTVTLTISGPGGQDSETKTTYIEVLDCYPFVAGELKVGYTLVEKYDIPDRQGIVYYQLDFNVNNWTAECMPDCVNLSAINPEGITPVAIVDLKYTAISGSGSADIPIKVGQSIPWAPSGFLRGEITYTRNGETKVNVSFRAKTTFPDAGDPTIIVAPEVGDYTFDDSNDTFGIEDTNSIIRLIKFGSGTFNVTEVCNAINNAFDGEVMALPDEFGRLVLFTKRGEYLRVVGVDQGSTANSVFGFYEFGEINTPDYEKEIAYTVTLYLVGVLQGTSIDTSLSKSLKEYMEHKVVNGTMQLNSYNWYEDKYGQLPAEVGASLFVTPGHRILGVDNLKLTKIEAFRDPSLSEDENYVDDSGDVPYWEGMEVGSAYNEPEDYVWNLGDDKRFFTRTFIDLSDSIYCIMGHYRFMAPGPVLPYQITANVAGPYDLGDANSCDQVCYEGAGESRNRFLAIRKVELSGGGGTDWFYVELPYGSLTADEIVENMKRQDYQVSGSVATYAPNNITMTTSLLNEDGYLVLGRNTKARTTDIKFTAVSGKLRISIPNNEIYGIRLGGSPELVFANSIFGWDPLGEFGDPVSDGFYYRYTYEVDACVATSPHPTSGYKQTLILEEANTSKYEIVVNAPEVDKANKIVSAHLNLLATVYDPELICLYDFDPPIIPDGEYDFDIPPCEPVTFSEITARVPCDVELICDQAFPFTEITTLVTLIVADPILSEFGASIRLANPTDIIEGKKRILTALNNLLTADYVNDPDITSGSGFATEAASAVTTVTTFTTTDLHTHVNTLISNIQSKWATDYFGAIKDIANFIVSYVTSYNSTAASDGVKYKVSIVSSLYGYWTTFTIATQALLNAAVAAIRTVMECEETKSFTCVADKSLIVYPIVIDTASGEERVADTIKIEYCTCNLYEEYQITVTMSPEVNSTLKGVVHERTTSELIALDFPYAEFDMNGDPQDSSGVEIVPADEYEFALPENAIPMYYEIDDEVQTGTDSLIKEVTWYPKLHKVIMKFCGTTQSSLVFSVEDCIILNGDEVWTFTSNVHDETISLDLSGRSKIMLDDLIDLLEAAFQPLTVTLSADETTVTITGDAIEIVVVSVPTVDPLDTRIDYEDMDLEMNLKIRYGYYHVTGEDPPERVKVGSVVPALDFDPISYDDDSAGSAGSAGG